MLMLGIDEAGRGSVIGPMVIAGVLAKEEDLLKFEDMGVTDSKLLSPKRRKQLYKSIKKIAKDFAVLKVSAKEIDSLRGKRVNLNKIEAERIAKIIKVMDADVAYVDTPQVSTEKFKKILMGLAKNHTDIVCENFADMKYVICGAASIIAKVERDKEIEKIKKRVNFDFGVGYSHDQRSINFLKKCLKKGKYSDFVRKSWITAIELLEEKEQKNLKDF